MSFHFFYISHSTKKFTFHLQSVFPRTYQYLKISLSNKKYKTVMCHAKVLRKMNRG